MNYIFSNIIHNLYINYLKSIIKVNIKNHTDKILLYYEINMIHILYITYNLLNLFKHIYTHMIYSNIMSNNMSILLNILDTLLSN